MHSASSHHHVHREPVRSHATAPNHGRIRSVTAEWLTEADIRIGGNRPWDLRVIDERLFSAIARRGATGLGDAYVDGWWECERLDEFFHRVMRARLPHKLRWHPYVVATYLRDLLVNAQTRNRAFRNARAHYDLGAPLFEAMLDPHMAYSCGYWRGVSTLHEAQTAKLDLVCRKLGLGSGMSVLDIGCGWGSFVKYAGQNHNVSCTGVTVSNDQAQYARNRCSALDVEIILDDYRSMNRQFDRIASIGMFEHVGNKNHRTFMKTAHRCLKDDGLFLLHTFAVRESFPNRTHCEVDWIERHIFPGLVVPSMKQIGAAVDGLFVIEDVENFGSDYDPTLMAWHENFEQHWPELSRLYDERFHRMWRYYLMICAAAFRSRDYQLWQFVLSKRGVPGGYCRPI
jgi:cyclopropane-fatty-acyl-phospholipid synthase